MRRAHRRPNRTAHARAFTQPSSDRPRRPIPRRGADHIAPDCAGQNFYAGSIAACATCSGCILRRTICAGWSRISIASARWPAAGSTQLARIADKNPPVLHARDRFGRDEDLIDYHSSYREMEQIAFGDFQFHAMSHRAGVLGMDRPLPAVAKYALQYLFVQAEFGLMCPISVTDTSIHLIRKFASAELQEYLLPKMLSGDLATMWKGTQFMTERAGGSDVGAIETDGAQGRRHMAAVRRQMVLLACRRRRGTAAGAAGGRARRHQGPGAVRDAAPAQGRQPQRLSHRPPQGQARHPLDGVGRDPAGRRRGVSGRRGRPRPQADDGAGQPVAAVARRSRRRDDAALRQRGDDVRAPAARRSARPSSTIRCCAASCSRSSCRPNSRCRCSCSPPAPWTAPMPARRPAEAALRILTPLLKFRACRDNIPVAIGIDGSARRQRLYRGMGACAADPRRPCRRALGRHQQYQRARHRHPRGRQERQPPHAGGRADKPAQSRQTHPRRDSATACAPRSTARWFSPSASRPSRRWKPTRGRRQARSITSPAPS